jgi:hypothetical protein
MSKANTNLLTNQIDTIKFEDGIIMKYLPPNKYSTARGYPGKTYHCGASEGAYRVSLPPFTLTF